jgi:Tfp pilus assembly protein PilE
MELLITVIILMIITRFAIPTYRVAVEQNRVDLAGSRLLMIYTAQRMYFVDKGEYARNIYQLTRDAKLLDRALEPGGTGDTKYQYTVTSPSPYNTFSASATRLTTPAPQSWTGSLTIDHNGTLGGSVTSTDGSKTLQASKYALGL